jgi:hypothetical protein
MRSVLKRYRSYRTTVRPAANPAIKRRSGSKCQSSATLETHHAGSTITGPLPTTPKAIRPPSGSRANPVVCLTGSQVTAGRRRHHSEQTRRYPSPCPNVLSMLPRDARANAESGDQCQPPLAADLRG